MKCADCKFWVGTAGGTRAQPDFGECHRHAPAALVSYEVIKGDLVTPCAWPATAQDTFCGDYVPKTMKQPSFV